MSLASRTTKMECSMASTMNILLLFLAGVTAVFVLYRLLRKSSLKIPLPPGPPSGFLVGNLRQIPRTSAWKTYSQWSKIYNSKIISMASFGKRIVVLNSAQVASDLLDKRGSIYSERPYNVMIQDLMGIGDNSIAFMPYNDKFRLYRKAFNTALNIKSARDYFPIQEKEVCALLDRLLRTPDKWRSHLRRTSGSTILTVTYGHQVTTEDDDLIKLSEVSMNYVRQAMPPASFLVNLLPSLKYIPDWMPGTHFKQFGREGRKIRSDLMEIPWKVVKKKIASGIAIPSYTTKLLEDRGRLTGGDEEEDVIKYTAGSMYAAGSDTTSLAVITFIHALVLHPEVQTKAQAEIDTVVGNNRLPTFADQSSLPYLQAVLSETLRWNPVSPLGLPHAVHQDDVYNGMFIPKGSIVIANIWAMLHDETMYPEPFKFWPERFDGRFPGIREPRTLAFGFNRRICPGRYLAFNSLFIQAANLVAVFDFKKFRDGNGIEIEPLVDYSTGQPMPFKCTITPRSEATIALIKSSAFAMAA